MADELDIAYDKTSVRHGQHRRHRRSGRLGRIGRAADRRLADAPRRRRSAARAARHGLDAVSACRSAQLAVSDGVISVTADPSQARHLRRADRRQAVQRHADRQQHRRDDRRGAAQDGAGAEDRRPVAAALRHSRQGGRLAEVGRRRQAARHGARAQREAAGGRRHARQHRRIVGAQHSRASSRSSARATTSPSSASARSRRSGRRGSSRSNWQKPATAPFPSVRGSVHLHAGATPTFSAPPTVAGNPDAALAGAAQGRRGRVRRAVPGAHGVRAGARDGRSVERSDDDLLERHEVVRPAQRRRAVPQMPRDRVRVVWMEGPQAYGRTAADDAGFEAAFLAKEIGRPVRVQWMRQEETAWDTKGPAYAVKMRGGARCAGQPRRARLRRARRRPQSPRLQRARHGADRAAHRACARRTPARGGAVDAVGHVRRSPTGAWRTHVVGLPLVWETPLRTGNLRDPERPAGDVRVRVVHRRAGGGGEGRSGRVPAEAADREHRRRQRLQARALDRRASRRRRRSSAGTPRPSPQPRRHAATSSPAAASPTRTAARPWSAQIAEVEVNRRTGRVWVKRLVCAHDCGLVINPEALRRTLEGGMLHSLSRALHEEVRFDTEKVTSVDWASHPDADARRHARARSTSCIVNGDPNPEPARPAALRRRRDGVQADARGGGQRDLRRDRRAPAPRAVPRPARAGGAQSGNV